MVNRPFWVERVEGRWRHRSVLWLRGVRRTGKTTLAQSLRDIEYFDCELPRIRRSMEAPEWSAKEFDPANFQVFARTYPKADLFVATTDAEPAFFRELEGRRLQFLTLDHLIREIRTRSARPEGSTRTE